MAEVTVDSLALLGWMDEDEALHLLREQCVLRQPLSDEAARSLWSRYRDRTEAASGAATFSAVAMRPATGERVEKFLAATRGFASAVVEVEPAKLIAHQFVLATTRSAEHAASSTSWAERCLPTERPAHALQITQRGNSILFEVPHGEHALIVTPEGQLRVDQFPPFVMLATVRDRLVLRAGYHRAYAYQSARPVPAEPFLAAMTDGAGLHDLHEPSLLAKLTAVRPPLLGDFLNPDLALPVRAIMRRFRFKVTAEMEAVPIDESQASG